MTNLAKVTDLTKFRQVWVNDLKGWVPRKWYRECGVFGKNDEFGESGGFGEISPNVKIRANDLKGWVPRKWRIWRK